MREIINFTKKESQDNTVVNFKLNFHFVQFKIYFQIHIFRNFLKNIYFFFKNCKYVGKYILVSKCLVKFILNAFANTYFSIIFLMS